MITIDGARARKVFGRLIRALRKNEYPYNMAVLPQQAIPNELKRDPLRHAQFLFYMCHFMRGALDSVTATRQLVALWREDPDMFIPDRVSLMTRARVEYQLSRTLDYHIAEIAGFWITNSDRLRRYWSSDPRKIFRGVTHGEQLRERMMNIRTRDTRRFNGVRGTYWGFEGYQGKMTSMFAYYMMYAGLVNHIRISPPIDFHHFRDMFATAVLVPNSYDKKLTYEDVYEYGVEAIEQYLEGRWHLNMELADALWLLSSTLCAIAPGNRSVGRAKKKGQNVHKTLPEQIKIDPRNTEHLRWYQQSCGMCPVAQYCRFNVPSGPYYVAGQFKLYHREKLPLMPQLFEQRVHIRPQKVFAGNLEYPDRVLQLDLLKNDPDTQ